MVFAGLFGRGKRNRWAVDRLHRSILAQALRPEFFDESGVRDNFSGRFEVTSLHATLVFRRLRALGGAGKAMAQDCFDALFDGFDEALRDIGTGDLSVAKKIRKMGEAFYGRNKAYEEAMAADAPDGALREALGRNLGLSEAGAERFERYVRAVEETLGRHGDKALLSGEVNWPRIQP